MFRRDWFIPIVVLAVITIAAVLAMATNPSISDADMREARAVVKRNLDAYQRHDGPAICAELISPRCASRSHAATIRGRAHKS